jgi:hypothetical protein
MSTFSDEVYDRIKMTTEGMAMNPNDRGFKLTVLATLYMLDGQTRYVANAITDLEAEVIVAQ